jgi:hypothetical protein
MVSYHLPETPQSQPGSPANSARGIAEVNKGALAAPRPLIDPFPKAYAYWPDFAQCRWRERVAILRETNNVPDNQPLPWQALQIATQQAEAEIKFSAGRGK